MLSESYQARWKREDRKKFPDKYRKYSGDYYSRNKEQRIEKVKEYQKNNAYLISKKKKSKYESQGYSYMKDKCLIYNYGITFDDYQSMYKEQNGNCKICSDHHEVLHVDHCHKSNKIRGLLCQKCNHGLGLFKDNPDILKVAIDYLNK